MRARITQAKKTILIYGLTAEENAKLSALAEEKKIACKAVSDRETALTVAQLLYGENPPQGEEEAVDGKFAVLDGFGNKEREGTALINAVDASVLKAVRTPYNGGWKFKDLCKELKKEHAVMHKGKN